MLIANVALANVFVFVSLIVWGLYIPVRRLTETSGQLLAIHFFIAEAITICLLATFFGSITSDNSSWFDERYIISRSDEWEKVLLIFVGGLAVGTGDFVALVVSQYVPGAIAFVRVVDSHECGNMTHTSHSRSFIVSNIS